MRRRLTIFIVVLLGVRIAFAIKKASSDEIKAIQEQIFTAKRMDKEIGDAQQDVNNADKSKLSAEAIRQLEKVVQREKDKQNAALTKAIHMTIAAYELEPPSRVGTSVIGWTKGRSITWLPVARDRESRQMQNADGDLKELPQPKKSYDAVTYPDGVSYIDPDTFHKGVGVLASTLLHERTHFEQLTTIGRMDKMSYAEGQAEAFKAELDNKDFFFDPNKDKGQIAEIAGWLQEEQAKVNQEKEARKGFKGLFRRAFPPLSPDIFESRRHTDEELEALKKQSDGFDVIVNQELRDMRAEHMGDNFLASLRDAQSADLQANEIRRRKQDQENELKEAEKRRKKEAEERLRLEREAFNNDPAWPALKQWAHVACRYIETPTFIKLHERYGTSMSDESNDFRFEAERISHESEDREYLLHNLVVMRKKDIVSHLDGGDGLTACQKDMVRLLLQARDPLSVEWLAVQMDRLRGGGAAGAIVNGADSAINTMGDLASAIGRGFAVFVEGITSPFVGGAAEQSRSYGSTSSGGSGNSSSSSGSGGNSGASNSSGHAVENTQSRRQLNGIASGNTRYFDSR